MSIQKDGKTYYSIEEIDTKLKESMRKNAHDLVEELREMN